MPLLDLDLAGMAGAAASRLLSLSNPHKLLAQSRCRCGGKKNAGGPDREPADLISGPGGIGSGFSLAATYYVGWWRNMISLDVERPAAERQRPVHPSARASADAGSRIADGPARPSAVAPASGWPAP